MLGVGRIWIYYRVKISPIIDSLMGRLGVGMRTFLTIVQGVEVSE
jgi:hypothetical protein